jgi:DNA/RNA endonuclease YhcR with UshA esterase domain
MEPEMKFAIMAISVAAVAAWGSSAQAGAISPREAQASDGQNVIVEGTARIHEDAAQPGMDVELTGHDNGHLLGFVPQGSVTAFPDLKSYDGKTVDITGVVQTSDGQAEIRITSPRQLVIASSG